MITGQRHRQLPLDVAEAASGETAADGHHGEALYSVHRHEECARRPFPNGAHEALASLYMTRIARATLPRPPRCASARSQSGIPALLITPARAPRRRRRAGGRAPRPRPARGPLIIFSYLPARGGSGRGAAVCLGVARCRRRVARRAAAARQATPKRRRSPMRSRCPSGWELSPTPGPRSRQRQGQSRRRDGLWRQRAATTRLP